MTQPQVRLVQLGLVVGLLALLEYASRAGLVARSVLPGPPTAILRVSFDQIFVTGSIWEPFRVTAFRVVTAFAIACAIGFSLGLLLWKSAVFAAAFEPIIAALYAVPWLALYPIFLVLMGLGDAPIIVTAAILGFVPVALNTYVGLREMKAIYGKVGRAYGLSRMQTVVKILIPAGIPYIVAGLKLGFLYTYLGVVGTEFLRSTSGLGFLVQTSYAFFKDLDLYAYIVFVVAITLILFYALDWLDRRIAGRFT